MKSTAIISAMDLRKEPGTILDRVDLRQETLVIERAGKRKAVLVPAPLYDKWQQLEHEAREEFWAMTEEIRKNVAQSGLSEAEIQTLVDEAVADVRQENAAKRKM
jgi:prevent-host-death family protein